jgi:hypothetical protein
VSVENEAGLLILLTVVAALLIAVFDRDED